MRLLFTLILVLAAPRAAAADDAIPELLVGPDLRADTDLRIRFGLAPLDGVSGYERSGELVSITTVRAGYAVREDLEVSLAVSSALVTYSGREFLSYSGDGGVGLPALGVEWSRPLGRVRIGAGAIAAIGARTPAMTEDPYPADVAAGAFFVDPEVVWTRAHMGLVHGGAMWSDGRSTVGITLGLQGYAGGVLPEPVTILRASGGAAKRLGERWTGSVEVLVESDVLHEALADGTDVVPAVTAGIVRRGDWDLGLGVSKAWTFAPVAQGEAPWAFLLDLSRRY